MTAPAGVSEGTPHEPVKAGATPAERAMTEQAAETQAGETQAAETQAAEAQAGASEAPAGTTTAEGRAAGPDAEATAAQPAEPGKAELPLTAEPAKPWTVAPADLGTAEAELAGAELVDGGMPGEARTGRDVSPLAVAGIIIGVIALVGLAAGALAIVTHGFKPKTVVTYRPAAVYKLQPGQCVDGGTSGLPDTVVSCRTAHDAEVFASFQLTGSWPGSAGVKQEASDGCASRFSDYLNPQLATAALDQQFVYPNEQAWHAGERTVVCEVSSSDGKLTGSVRTGA